jgi:hypothetical protein
MSNFGVLISNILTDGRQAILLSRKLERVKNLRTELQRMITGKHVRRQVIRRSEKHLEVRISDDM